MQIPQGIIPPPVQHPIPQETKTEEPEPPAPGTEDFVPPVKKYKLPGKS